MPNAPACMLAVQRYVGSDKQTEERDRLKVASQCVVFYGLARKNIGLG